MEETLHQCPVSSDSIFTNTLGILGILFSAVIIFICLKWKVILGMLCDRVFTYVDVDCSGTIDHTEMNMAVILLFGEINKYVRVERPSRDDVKRYFDETDIDGNGELDRQEFKQMMMLIGANTIQRVVTVIAITLLSPVIAHKAVDLFKSIAKTRFHAATVVAVFGHEKNLNCIRAETTRAFPFFNEQLVTTIVSVIIVTTAVPFMFNQYDKMLLGKKEELKKISVNIPGIQDGTTAKASPSTDMTKQENSDGDIPYVRKNQQVHRKLRQRRDSSGWKSRKEKSSEEEEGWATRELRRKPIKVPNPELLMSSRKRRYKDDDGAPADSSKVRTTRSRRSRL